MWWLRQELRARLSVIKHEAEGGFVASNGYRARAANARVERFEALAEESAGDESQGVLDGTCTIRHAKGRRSLFFDLTLSVPWRAVTDEGTPDERSLGGKTKLWNIAHHHEFMSWRHENHRNTHEVGPAMDAMAERLAPAMAAYIKFGVQEVIGKLMSNKIDLDMLLASMAPPRKPKPKPKMVGTINYAKWDDIDDSGGSEAEEERIVEVG